MTTNETNRLGILDSNQYITDSESAALPVWLIPNKYNKYITLIANKCQTLFLVDRQGGTK